MHGDDTQVRDLQGKMIAHCENMGDRMAILDSPPDLLPQEILEWRMNTAGYDSKMSALYYPWIEVMDPLANRPINIPPSGHVAGVWCRTDETAACTRRRPTRSSWAPTAWPPGHARGAGRPQQGRHQLHPRVPRPRHPRLGRPHAVERPGVALHQRAPAVQLHLRVDHEGTQWSVFEPNDHCCGSQLRNAASSFLTGRGGRRAVRQAPARRSTSSATRRPTRLT